MLQREGSCPRGHMEPSPGGNERGGCSSPSPLVATEVCSVLPRIQLGDDSGRSNFVEHLKMVLSANRR